MARSFFSPKYSKRPGMLRGRRRSLLSRVEALEPRLMLNAAPVSSRYWDYNVLLRFDPGTSPSDKAAAISSVGGTVEQSFKGASAGLLEVRLPAAQQNEAGLHNALTTLNANTRVRYAEPNFLFTTDAIPNDPQFNELWGMNNTGQLGGTIDADIDAVEAWDLNTGSSATVIAVIDTGTDYTHADLAANIFSNPLETPGDGIDNDGNGYIDDIRGWDAINDDNDPMDDDGHGTHVSGTVGAVGNNGVGVVGVNWNVQIMPVKFLGPLGGSLADAIEAVDYVTGLRQRGINVRVSNNSWGGGGFSQALKDAIQVHGDAGILFVAAAGNGGIDGIGDNLDQTPDYPAGYDNDNIISVAATNRNDGIAGFSNFGLVSVDLGAPGVEILSTFPPAIVPAGYGLLDGTSMASPHVAGAVGMLFTVAPFLTSAEIKDILLRGVDPIPALNGITVTGGRLNLRDSLELVGASIVQGTVFTDKAGDGVIQAGVDTPLANIIVWHDADKNGALDPNEQQTLSDANGFYQLIRLPDPPGGVQIRMSPPPLYVTTVPAAGFYTVDFAFNGEIRSNLNFGVFGPPGEVHGHKWLDRNGNASLDAADGDGGLAGIWIYVDADGDGRLGIGDPSAKTDANGAFIIRNVPVGTFFLREVIEPGWSASFPQANNGAHQFTMTPRGVITGLDFFNSPAFDYGDAPDTYRTLTASGGPSHGFRRGFQLGGALDADPDGRPTVAAVGDDNAFSDDEEGVRFLTALTPGKRVDFEVTVNVPAFTQNGYLHGWIDLNGDGDFTDAGEKVVRGVRLGTGTHAFSVNVPASIPVRPTFARFRYSTQATLGIGGSAFDGEVEDYRVQVFREQPVANDDGDQPPLDAATPDILVQQGRQNFRIDVLANDVRSTQGRIQIVRDEFRGPTGKRTTAGGTVTISTNGTPTDPYDDILFYDAAPPPSGHVGRNYFDSFEYTITDGVNTDTATVWITLEKLSTAPTPLDDIAVAQPNLTAPATRSVTIPVLLNDNPGTDRGVPLNRVDLVGFDTQVRNGQGQVIGTVTRDDRGTPTNKSDDRLVFTPAVGANNTTGQFKYTVNNPGSTTASLNRQATVTVQIRPLVGQPDANDQIKLSIRTFDVGANNSIGTETTRTLVRGQEYWVGVFADDLRASFTLGGGGNGNGALTVYLDMLYDDRFVSAVRVPKSPQNPLGLEVVYGPAYDNNNFGASGEFKPGGLIDELGIGTTENVGPANQAVLFVKFRATGATPGTGTIALWKSDPADERSEINPAFEHDILVNDEAGNHPIRTVELENIAYLRSVGYRVVPPSLSPAMATSSSAPTTSSSSPSSTAVKPATSSVVSSGPSQQELLAYFASVGTTPSSSGISSSGIASSNTSSTQAIDDVLAALYGGILASKK